LRNAGNILKELEEDDLSFNEKYILETKGHQALKKRKRFIRLVAYNSDKALADRIEAQLNEQFPNKLNKE